MIAPALILMLSFSQMEPSGLLPFYASALQDLEDDVSYMRTDIRGLRDQVSRLDERSLNVNARLNEMNAKIDWLIRLLAGAGAVGGVGGGAWALQKRRNGNGNGNGNGKH